MLEELMRVAVAFVIAFIFAFILFILFAAAGSIPHILIMLGI